jgi:hypothetical protein
VLATGFIIILFTLGAYLKIEPYPYMENKKFGINTLCTHAGELEDTVFRGAVSPLYMSTSYAFEDVEVKRYPRYFNTPNQVALAKKNGCS